MFGFSEIVFTLLVAVVALKPSDWPKILKKIYTFRNSCYNIITQYKKEVFSQINDLHEERELKSTEDNIIMIGSDKYIQAEDGNLYRTYDVKDL